MQTTDMSTLNIYIFNMAERGSRREVHACSMHPPKKVLSDATVPLFQEKRPINGELFSLQRPRERAQLPPRLRPARARPAGTESAAASRAASKASSKAASKAGHE